MFAPLIFILALIFFVPAAVSATTNHCEIHQCITVIDVGSSGSRIHIYSYDLDETHTPIHINEIWNKKVKPGFASLEPNYLTLTAYLNELFADAPNHKAPVYFYATAGMRLLPFWKQKLFYQHVQNWFSGHPALQLVEAKTITGAEEALYDWLSVNEHLGTLQSVQASSVGVMDMGGASVQIVFPVEENESIQSDSVVNMSLHGQTIHLFVQSFLGLGQTEMSHQFLNSSSCFAQDYPLPDGKKGAGNVQSCVQELAVFLNTIHGVNRTVQPVLTHYPVKSWYALGGLTNLADNKIFNLPNGELTNQHLLEQADESVCHQSWRVLDSLHPKDEYIYGYCLFSAYFYALMVEGYGLLPEQKINYIPPQTNLDWTRGVVLNHQ